MRGDRRSLPRRPSGASTRCRAPGLGCARRGAHCAGDRSRRMSSAPDQPRQSSPTSSTTRDTRSARRQVARLDPGARIAIDSLGDARAGGASLVAEAHSRHRTPPRRRRLPPALRAHIDVTSPFSSIAVGSGSAQRYDTAAHIEGGAAAAPALSPGRRLAIDAATPPHERRETARHTTARSRCRFGAPPSRRRSGIRSRRSVWRRVRHANQRQPPQSIRRARDRYHRTRMQHRG